MNWISLWTSVFPEQAPSQCCKTNEPRHQRPTLPNDGAQPCPSLVCGAGTNRSVRVIKPMASGTNSHENRAGRTRQLNGLRRARQPSGHQTRIHSGTGEKQGVPPGIRSPSRRLEVVGTPRSQEARTRTQSRQCRVRVQTRREVRLLPWKERRMLILVSTSNGRASAAATSPLGHYLTFLRSEPPPAACAC